MRTTKIRTDLLKFFEREKKPVSAPELLAVLSKKNPTLHKTTIYRELNFLKLENIIRDVYLSDGIIRFEKKDEECHHHLICENCGKISDVIVNEDDIIKKIQKENNFTIKNHSIEFFGQCRDCK